MKTTKMLVILFLAMGPVVWSGQATVPGSVVGWGHNGVGQAEAPAGNDFVAIAAGNAHSLALKSDGSIVGWGQDHDGQATPPPGNDFVAIAAGHSYSLGMKSDGSIVGWGSNTLGQANPRAGDFVAIAAGESHSLALKSDGSIIGWGYNSEGQATPPGGTDFVAIAAGRRYGLALKSDGSIVGWGGIATPPAGRNFVAITGGGWHALALKSEGSIVGWGDNRYGQVTPPVGLDFVAIAAGEWHSMALRGDGSIVCWGWNYRDMATPPEGNDFVAIAGGGSHSLAIRSTPTPTPLVGPEDDNVWIVSGDNMYSVPTGNVGIGTDSPSEKLDVAGAANLNKGKFGIALRVNGAEALWYNGVYFSWGYGGTANFFADAVGIGQVDPGPHKLYVNGTGYATGGFWASDLRFKKNIRTIDSPMDKINNIRGVSFEWKRSEYQDKGFPEGEHYGVIAQEIEQVLPEIVKEGPDGDKAVSYTELVPILTEAIKEQQKQLEEQRIQVEYLFQKVEWLERIVQQQFAAAR